MNNSLMLREIQSIDARISMFQLLNRSTDDVLFCFLENLNNKKFDMNRMYCFDMT